MQIIPAIDLKDGKCVRLLQGDPARETVFSPEPVEVALHWQELGARRLHVVDLDGAFEGSPRNWNLVEKIVKAVKIPVQLGGGLREEDTVLKVLGSGVERIILGTSAVEDPNFLLDLCDNFPNRIMAGIDARNGLVAVSGWARTTKVDAVQFASALSAYKLAGIVYTDISTDGMLKGPNLAGILGVARATAHPVIASGGVSSLEDIRAVKKLAAKGVVGIIVGRALYTGDIKLSEALAAAQE
jgi:phosphoribosylformimino-5-aminoimidazole carboxamide ribotide isomerase